MRSLSRAAALDTITDLRSQLDSVLDEIEEQRRNPLLSLSHQSYLNDYAAVRIAGYLEQICFHAISGRLGEVTSGSIQTFINSWFHKAPNLTSTQLRELFKRFGSDIDSRIKDFLEEGLNRTILDSLLETRNAVAHGKEYSQTSRGNLESFRLLLNDLEVLVRSILLDDDAPV